jgi:hypothetical protein
MRKSSNALWLSAAWNSLSARRIRKSYHPFALSFMSEEPAKRKKQPDFWHSGAKKERPMEPGKRANESEKTEISPGISGRNRWFPGIHKKINLAHCIKAADVTRLIILFLFTKVNAISEGTSNFFTKIRFVSKIAFVQGKT